MLKRLFYALILVVLILLAVVCIYRYALYPREFSDIVEHVSKKYTIDPYLIYAIIKQESNFNTNALSSKNAKGLMQLMDGTAKEQADHIEEIDENFDIWDYKTNITIGTRYFSELVNRYNGNIYIAIAAYNAGIGNVNNWFPNEYSSYNTYDKVIEQVEYNETKRYLTNVINYYDMYKRLYN